jgi:hypothetical protein
MYVWDFFSDVPFEKEFENYVKKFQGGTQKKYQLKWEKNNETFEKTFLSELEFKKWFFGLSKDKKSNFDLTSYAKKNSAKKYQKKVNTLKKKLLTIPFQTFTKSWNTFANLSFGNEKDILYIKEI